MTPKLEQNVGPPIATPERLTRAKQNVVLAGDNASLPPASRFCKPFRAKLTSALANEINLWLAIALADQSPDSQLASLTNTLLAMRWPKRTQLRLRRIKAAGTIKR
jgi:hypothetical protein